jgi:hypothetical protein
MSSGLAKLKQWLLQREEELRVFQASVEAEQAHYFGPGCLWDQADEKKHEEYERKRIDTYSRRQEIRGVLNTLDRLAIHPFVPDEKEESACPAK